MRKASPLSSSKKAGYQRLFAKLRKRKNAADDQLAAELHDKVFADIQCLECANCCKTHPPLINERDIERISGHLKMRPSEFTGRYIEIDEDGDWVFHTVPCTFLNADNTCRIYEVRPAACREYPHTNRKKLYQIEAITLANAAICPAVAPILDLLHQKIEKL